MTIFPSSQNCVISLLFVAVIFPFCAFFRINKMVLDLINQFPHNQDLCRFTYGFGILKISPQIGHFRPFRLL